MKIGRRILFCCLLILLVVTGCTRRALLAENRGATSQRLITSAVRSAFDVVDLKALRSVPTAITIGHLSGRGGSRVEQGTQGLLSIGGIGGTAAGLLSSLGLGGSQSPTTASGGMGTDINPGRENPAAGTALEPVTGVFADYLYTELRVKAEEAGVPLVPHKDARAHIILLVHALGTDEDHTDGLLSLWSIDSLRGEAWFRLVAVEPATGKMLLDQPLNASHYFKHLTVLGIGPFQQSSLPGNQTQKIPKEAKQ